MESLVVRKDTEVGEGEVNGVVFRRVWVKTSGVFYD